MALNAIVRLRALEKAGRRAGRWCRCPGTSTEVIDAAAGIFDQTPPLAVCEPCGGAKLRIVIQYRAGGAVTARRR